LVVGLIRLTTWQNAVAFSIQASSITQYLGHNPRPLTCRPTPKESGGRQKSGLLPNRELPAVQCTCRVKLDDGERTDA
jgi:hypothetical protein